MVPEESRSRLLELLAVLSERQVELSVGAHIAVMEVFNDLVGGRAVPPTTREDDFSPRELLLEAQALLLGSGDGCGLHDAVALCRAQTLIELALDAS